MIQTFFERLVYEYADIISMFAIPMVIAIFAFAFPMLLDTANKVDSKYKSTLLMKMFINEHQFKCFKVILYIALLCSALYIMKFPRYVDWGETVNLFIDNSALILLVLSTFALIIATIIIICISFVYYTPDKLLKRLSKKYKHTTKRKNNLNYFNAASELLFYSLKKDGEPLDNDLQIFYAHVFYSYRHNKENKTIEYPDEYYNVLFKTHECICQSDRRQISLYNKFFYILIFDEFQHTIISEKSYNFIWKCICLSLLYNKDELIVSYWQDAHQYINLWLPPINSQYDNDFNITNQPEIDRRNAEREKFIEFHYALGGLLMMKEKYALLNRLMSWSNSNPPKYELVPETMADVIIRFTKIESKAGYINPVYYEQRYPFPDVYGVNADNIIKTWIKRYIAVLFFRQYTIDSYLINKNRLNSPCPPESLQEKREWIKELNGLKTLVYEYMSDGKYLNALDMNKLCFKKWYLENNKPTPDSLINELINTIKKSAEIKKVNQVLSSQKIKKFNDATKKVLIDCFDYYKVLSNNIISDTDAHNSIFYGGRHELMDKMAFADEQDIGYGNFEQITAELIAAEFKHNMPSVFRKNYECSYYLLREKDVFTAIDCLHLDNNQYTIVSVGVYLDMYKMEFNVNIDKKQGKWSYKGIPIIELENTMIDIVSDSFFIIKNNDLPYITHNKIDDKNIEKYNLEEIDHEYHIYTNIINLEQREDIKEKVQKETNIQDLSKSVLVCVDVETEIRCRSKAKCIQIKVFSQFNNQGSPNNIDVIKNIWNEDDNK